MKNLTKGRINHRDCQQAKRPCVQASWLYRFYGAILLCNYANLILAMICTVPEFQELRHKWFITYRHHNELAFRRSWSCALRSHTTSTEVRICYEQNWLRTELVTNRIGYEQNCQLHEAYCMNQIAQAKLYKANCTKHIVKIMHRSNSTKHFVRRYTVHWF